MIKSLIYRIYSFVITFIISFLISENIDLSITLSIVETLFKIITYYWFDNLWNRFTKKEYSVSVLFFTGLSGSGKTTIAKGVLNKLHEQGHNAMLLDGDEIRHIFKNTGYDKDSRYQHIQDVSKMAAYLQKQGIIPIVSLISPYKEARNAARQMSNNFIEIYVNTPLKICEKRDVKGLYKKARTGEIKNFTGVSAPYEAPEHPEIVIDTLSMNTNESVTAILKYLRNRD